MTSFSAVPRTVYFIRPAGERGPVKIGCSVNPEKRLAQIQVEHDSRLEIVATAPGSLNDERRVQSLFWHDHIRREWFNWSTYLQLLIDAAARGDADWETLPPTRVRRMPGRKRRFKQVEAA